MSGKSVTHRKSKSEPESELDGPLTEVKPWISAMRNRIRPSTSQAISHLPAAKKIQSPSSICNFVRNDSFSASEKNFTIGDFHSPFSTLMKARDRKSTRLNSSHVEISYAVFCLKKK